MTTNERAARKARMAAAATRRTEPAAEPPGRTAVRAKPVRITVDLTPELHRALTRWAASAAETLDVPRLSLADAIRAMIQATTVAGPGADAVQAILIRQAQ
jgi:hypothetical protein